MHLNGKNRKFSFIGRKLARNEQMDRKFMFMKIFWAQGVACPRRNISIGILLNLSIPTETRYIQPFVMFVENENSAKLQKYVILTYVRSFLAYMT